MADFVNEADNKQDAIVATRSPEVTELIASEQKFALTKVAPQPPQPSQIITYENSSSTSNRSIEPHPMASIRHQGTINGALFSDQNDSVYFGVIKPLRNHIVLNSCFIFMNLLMILVFLWNVELPPSAFNALMLFGNLTFFLLIGSLCQFYKRGREYFEIKDGTELPKWFKKSLRTAFFLVPICAALALTVDWYAAKLTESGPEAYDPNTGYVTELARENFAPKLETGAKLAFFNARTLDLLSKRAFAAGLLPLGSRLGSQAMSINPQNIYYVLRTTDAMLEFPSLHSEARTILNKYLTIYPRYGNLWAAKATLEERSGDYRNALIAANKHLEYHPKETRAIETRARILQKMGHTQSSN